MTSLQPVSEENGSASSVKPICSSSDHQVLETPGINFALEEMQAAGSEYEYVILPEVNYITVEYIENKDRNDEGLELEINGENEMIHEVSVHEIGGVVQHVEEMVLENGNMIEEANETDNNRDGDGMQ